MRLSGRVALVTGAASGLGAGIAEAFAAEGAVVCMVDVAEEAKAAAAVAAADRYGHGTLYHRADVAVAPQVADMAAVALGHFGRVDILVNNAGIFTESRLEDMPLEDWDRVIAVNLRGTFLCTRALIGQMLERGWGRIINMASQLGQIGGADVAHYSASKAGVIGFTKALAREVSTRGVLVNAIAPGPIRTPMLDGETEEWRSRKLSELPIGRFGEVDEVTPTAVLLASDGGSYYVGQTLGPNGGDVML
ncbi:SDR family oxidoreductase [Acidimicrobiaceae bacterium USS-CC1]|uniref:SDR family oxidoreductase n=1 Tax=Acidiferrimicrobium australe TaxID=2664430 RepID=A0ABW9QQZ4_9ACTN|nr:SDR family oxidoreductase [Acidiferrimicrobium australe]